jgi:ribosome-binding protein aMBF1 (putative translation factor)
MPRFSNKEIITSIQNGDEEILLYLAKEYFESSRSTIRRAGLSDDSTPEIFSTSLVKTCREIQQNLLSPNVEFEPFYNNVLREQIDFRRQEKKEGQNPAIDINVELVSQCFSILDDFSKKIITARYVEKLTFEKIASRFNFSNPVIAQFELNKAYRQFENIVRARFNKSLS